MRNPVARFNRMVMRNPLKWGGFTGAVGFGGAGLLLLSFMLEHPVGSGDWYLAGTATLMCLAMVVFFTWGFLKFHRLERRLEAEPDP